VHRIHGDKGYRGHNYPNRFKVWIRDQVRRVTKAIRRECAVAPPSHPRSAISGRSSDASQLSQRPRWRPVVLVAAGFNFGLLRRWSEELLLRVLLWILCRGLPPLRNAQGRSETFFTGDFAESLGIFATATLLAVTSVY
jgi:transposase, IS5 family